MTLGAELRTATVDGIQGLAELQVYGAAQAHADRVAEISAELAYEQQHLSSLNGLSQGMLGLTANLAMWLIVWTAIPLIHSGQIPPPDLAMLALFALGAFEAVFPLPAAFQVLGETRAAARRVFEIVDTPTEVVEPDGPSPTPRDFRLSFQGVIFAYPGTAHPALETIDLELPPGQRIAVTGPSGAGKSTLIQLLLRFRIPQLGRITLGGHDLAKYRGEDVRRYIAVVSQHTHLFTGTLRENLLLANPGASQGAIEQACRTAKIHDFITAQPQGYDTWIGEAGLTLSGGQAWRIAIARALLLDAPILILDEPTARSLLDAIQSLMEGRSVLLITHRTHGLGGMDEVLLMENGRVTSRS